MCDVQADFDVPHLDLEAAHEALEDGQSTFGLVFRAREAVQLEKELAQRRHQQGGQRLVLVGLQGHGAVASLGGHTLDFIEQHRLADTAQAGEEDAFLRALGFDATEEDASLFENSFATNHLGRWRTGPGRKRVFYGVHTMFGCLLVISTHLYLLIDIHEYTLIDMACKAVQGRNQWFCVSRLCWRPR